MDKNDVNGKIAVKQKEISVEIDSNKKTEMQKELQILLLRKEINFARQKIKQIKLGMK